jgi:hypothetical protein
MSKQYFKLETFIDIDLMNKVLAKDHIVKDATWKRRVQYGYHSGMGSIEPTGEYGYEDMTREVAIPKSTPDVVITEENYGDYLSGVVFDRIFMDKLIEIVTREL